MKKYVILKLLGMALLTMITLVIISILEVVIYSYLVNPGQGNSVYDAHAQFSAPYISGIFGFILFFLISWYWKRKKYQNVPRLIWLFPLTYLILDIVVLTLLGATNWSDFIVVYLLSNGAKFLGSFLGYKLTN